MKASILFRDSIEHREELAAARNWFDVRTSRSFCYDEWVIGRYSVLPYYRELIQDLQYNGSTLINSFDQHTYIAHFDYYEDIKDLTFETWFNIANVPEDTALVVKGRTNSRKWKWSTQMFAPNKKEAIRITGDLLDDQLIGSQGIVYRRYVPLTTYEIGINGQPFTNEWRFFFLGERLIHYGYYWTLLDDMTKVQFDHRALEIASKAASIISAHANFFVLDVAQDYTGRWWVVECNEGAMSGLSTINPEEFYKRLYEVISDYT